MKGDLLSECGGCGSSERWLLHNIRHRGAYRRLCTNCLLQSQQGLFCPHCLEVYRESPPPEQRVMCLKCPSISHLSCAAVDDAAAASPNFLCPPCSTSNFTFFNLNRNRLKPSDADGALLDKDSAKALVAAAQISAASMNKAAAVARVEAERRVKEATLAKKRAREALERLAVLAAKDKVNDAVSPKAIVKSSVSPTDQKSKHKLQELSDGKKALNQLGIQGKPRAGVGVSGESNDNKSRTGQGEQKGSGGFYSFSNVKTG